MLLTAGALVALCYDLFRSLRKAYPGHPRWLVHIQDGTFLVISIILLVIVFCFVDFGRIRWYSFALVISGIFIYFLAISPWFGKIITFLLGIPGKIFKIFYKFILKK